MEATDVNQAETLRNAAEAAMRAQGFEPEFSPAVIQEVRAIDEPADKPQPRDVRDMRGALWSSIDNRESRDLDQIELAERVGDSIRVCIGVADVDALVPIHSAADDHAANNTTSVYTGVVTFPMLPERLSTNLSSLNEGEDRLAVVVQFEVDANGDIGNAEIFRALVKNKAKLAYDPIGDWLAGKTPAPPAIAKSSELEQQLRLQQEAAQRLRRAREVAGALDFESVEATPVVANGKVVDLAVTRKGPGRDIGHFGLGVAEYVHSTAPNRRFADLVTQRLLRAVTLGDPCPYTDDEMFAIADRCTERGEAARKVERTMRKIAGATMLAERVGDSFAAVGAASSPEGGYAPGLSPPAEGRIVRGGEGIDPGDHVKGGPL